MSTINCSIFYVFSKDFQQLSNDIYLMPLLVKWCGLKTARIFQEDGNGVVCAWLFNFCLFCFAFSHMWYACMCVCSYICRIWVCLPVHMYMSRYACTDLRLKLRVSVVPILFIEKGSLIWNQSSQFWLIRLVNLIQGPLFLSTPMWKLEADCYAQLCLHDCWGFQPSHLPTDSFTCQSTSLDSVYVLNLWLRNWVVGSALSKL